MPITKVSKSSPWNVYKRQHKTISPTKSNRIAETNHFEMKVFVSLLFAVLLSISQLNAADVRRDDKVRIRFHQNLRKLKQ